MRLSLTLLAASTLMAACGQKGPLYLPDKNPRVITRPAPAADPAPENPGPQPAPATKPADPKDDTSPQ
jgi:predicted small lipoprotein YifL